MLPLVRGGEFARSLEACREGALDLFAALSANQRCVPLFAPELDIVVWAMRAQTASSASAMARAVFDSAAANGLHLALATFPRVMAEAATPVGAWDSDHLVCLRACVMKPEHGEWLPEILTRLRSAMGNG
jgi:hypothetical protein